MPDRQTKFMSSALDEARLAAAEGEVPVGAIIVLEQTVIARAHNTRERDKNPLWHAELKAIESAATIRGDWRLNDCDLYVTLEPCPMCLGALFQARVGRLFFGGFDEKRLAETTSPERNAFPSLKNRLSGEIPLILTSNNHALEVRGGILEAECADLLRAFFRARRRKSPGLSA